MNNGTIKLTVKSISTLEEFIHKMTKISRSLCLEISSSEIKCSTYKQQHVAGKYSTTPLLNVFEIQDEFPEDLIINLCLYDITQLTRAMNIFPKSEQIEITLEYVNSSRHKINLVTKIDLRSISLRLSVYTAQYESMNAMTREQTERAFSTDNSIYFPLVRDTISKVISLADYDGNTSGITVKKKDNCIIFCGETYEFKISNDIASDDNELLEQDLVNFSFAKEELKILDKENYIAYINVDNAIRFVSTDGFTKISIPKYDIGD